MLDIPNPQKGDLLDIDHIYIPLSQAEQIVTDSELTQNTLMSLVIDDWNKRSAQLLSLKSKLKTLQNSITQKQLNLSDNPNLYVTVGDSFHTDEKISSTSSISLDAEGGYVVLPLSSIENLNPYIKEITISQSSIGRPGDITAVRKINKTDTDLSVEIAEKNAEDVIALTDQNPDTWFTWEQISAFQLQPLQTIGKLGSTFFSLNSTLQDILKVSKNFGMLWKGIIPGQGEVSLPLINLVNSKAEIKKARLELTFTFSNSVPLSTVRLTPLADLNCPLPIVKEITIITDKGSFSPPGLPREITPNFGRFTEQPHSSVSINTLIGSGIFQTKTNVNANSVRIVLESDSIQLLQGIAHLFKLRLTNTSEKTYVLGLRISSKNSGSNTRISFTPSDSNPEKKTTLIGELYKVIPNYLTYVKRTSLFPAKSLNQVNTKFSVFKNKDDNQALNVQLSSIANNKASGVISIINKAAKTTNSLATLGGNKVSKLLGLGGPAGILIGAALNGDLLRRNKTSSSQDLIGVDVWDGYRAAIVLRDISFDSREYVEVGELITETLSFDTEVRAVSLTAQIQIPDSWGNGQWLQCFIKTLSGDYQEINPQGFNGSGDSAILFDIPVKEIQCKFILRRPTNNTSESPIFSGYIIKGLI